MISTGAASRFEYVGFWRRAIVALLDLLILSPLLLAFFWIDPWSFRLHAAWPSAVPSVAAYLLTLFFVVRFGGTPGKLILGMRIVDRNGAYLRLGRALARDSINWLSLVPWVILRMQVMEHIPAGDFPSSTKQVSDAIVAYGG
jgi:uncharacterized RDD family membrane protein YckC